MVGAEARAVPPGSPDHLAFVSPAGRLTYGALAAEAAALRRRLSAADAADRPVLVYGHQEPAMLLAIRACTLLGRPYVPADVSLPVARVARLAALAGVRVAVAARALPDELAAALRSLRVVVLGPDGTGRRGPLGDRPASGPADPLAYVIFTSGTTGDPKGVPVRRSAVAHFAAWLRGELRPQPAREVVLGQAPFSFDLSVMGLCLALGSGGTLFAVTRELVADPRSLFAALGASGLTLWVSTPSFARFCMAEPRFGAGLLPQLRAFVFCGETLPVALARGLLQRFPGAEVWNTYGPTEAAVAVTSVRVTEAMAAEPGALPVGRPAPGMRVWVAAPDGLSPLPPGTRGEIVIAGPQVGEGYLAGTSEVGAQGFCSLPAEFGGGTAYRTGDCGSFAGGLLYCEGRLDRQIKLHGYRLELGEIEAQLRRLPAVRDAVVLVVQRGGVADHLVAFAAAAGGPADAAEAFARGQALRAALGRQLPDYALPRLIRVLPDLPLTPNGKVDRRALESLL